MATTRRAFFCGNWKLNGSIAESLTLATDVRNGVATLREVDVANYGGRQDPRRSEMTLGAR